MNKSAMTPKRVTMEAVRKTFPADTDAARRKRLRLIADNSRTGECFAVLSYLRRTVRLGTPRERAHARGLVDTDHARAHVRLFLHDGQ